MKKYTLSLILLVLWAHAEPSAFSAGDLSQENPYGLTKNEELLLQNIQTVKTLKRDKNTLYSEAEMLKNDLDGLRSVVDGLNAQQQKHQKEYLELYAKFSDMVEEQKKVQQLNRTLESNVTLLLRTIKDTADVQMQNFQTLQSTIMLLDGTITKIETHYTPLKRVEALEQELATLKKELLGELKKINATPAKPALSIAQIYENAVTALEKKAYDDAIEGFNQAIASKYKPAASHYYAGEAYYHLENYLQAIAYFKESYALHKNGSWNKTLLLHTAISLYKTGNKSAAEGFFKRVIEEYAGSAEAKEAQKYLSK